MVVSFPISTSLSSTSLQRNERVHGSFKSTRKKKDGFQCKFDDISWFVDSWLLVLVWLVEPSFLSNLRESSVLCYGMSRLYVGRCFFFCLVKPYGCAFYTVMESILLSSFLLLCLTTSKFKMRERNVMVKSKGIKLMCVFTLMFGVLDKCDSSFSLCLLLDGECNAQHKSFWGK